MVVDEATGPLSSLLSSGCKASFRLQPLSLLILVTSQGGNSDMDADLSKSDGNPLLSRPANNIELTQLVDENSFLERPDTLEDGSKLEMNSFENGPKFLPFEFRALEACLESVCSCLESETGILEQEAYPALDELTSKISTLNLERVRQIKSRLVAISGRVQKVRDELEHLLDDDEDMAEMYLTNKLMQQHMDLTTSSSVHVARGQMEHKLPHSDAEEQSGFEALSGDGDSSTSGSTHSGTKGLDVEELEMLLDAYFIQIDGTLNKLSALREYVDDTKDYINIMLDDKQNQLLQMGVMLTTATLVVSLFVVVTGVLSINIRIELFDPDVAGLPHMSWTVGGCTSGCIFLYTVAIAWYKHKRIV